MLRLAGTPGEALVWCTLGVVLGFAHAEATQSVAPLQKGVPVGLQQYQVWQGGRPRRYLLYVPTQYKPEVPVPLWILAHGSGDTPEIFIKMADVTTMAEEHAFAFAALEAVDGAFNVGLDARADNPGGPDDVWYTRAVLNQAVHVLNVDMQRVRCAGFSRGARFCSRLASEVSSFITGIAVVSGVRFPKPNNATRPLPVISFHGSKDYVNPYRGDGYPYWKSSVPDAMRRWADFNGCTRQHWERLSMHVIKSVHTGCTDGADVVLLLIIGGGHTWPGSRFNFGSLGSVTKEINATDILRTFFVTHPVPPRCKTAVAGDPCYAAVTWAMSVGVSTHPEWYDGLTNSSSFEEFQEALHHRIGANCLMPCPRRKGAAAGAAAPKAKMTNVDLKDEQLAVVQPKLGDVTHTMLRAAGGVACVVLLVSIACTVYSFRTSKRLTSRALQAHSDPYPE